MWLNCKVIKKLAPPISTSTPPPPPFQVYPPFLAKILYPRQSDSIFGRSYASLPFNKGGDPTMKTIKFKTYSGNYIHKSFRLSMKNRYYIPERFVKGLRVCSHEKRKAFKPVWDFKLAWKQVLLVWRFISSAFQDKPIFWQA